MSKMEYTGNRGVFKLVSGGNEQTFMVIRGFDSHSETFTQIFLRMDPERCVCRTIWRGGIG